MVNENNSCKTLVEGISFDVYRLQIGCTYTTVVVAVVETLWKCQKAT